ncbi:MAG TPA: cytochrome c [Myxococcota bacterium]|nr:cytochrome c [Myxococcota bacterium]
MARSATYGLLFGTLTLAACTIGAHGEDPSAMMARWSLNYFGPCSSWLYSHSTGQRYCASPPFAVQVELPAAPAGPAFDTSKVDKDSLMEAGAKVYGSVCVACHQADGKGLPGQFPPLAGSGAFYGDAQNMARIAVHGLNAEIVVQGVTWKQQMPPQGHLSDYELAAAMTYARHSWGNNDGVVLPSDVAAVR